MLVSYNEEQQQDLFNNNKNRRNEIISKQIQVHSKYV